MVIYIHGFGGSGQGSKARAFREYFKSIEEDFIAPSLPYNPKLAIESLKELIASYKGDVCLIGSSLGGYYASYLSDMYEVNKVVLINPATKPYETLKRALGKAPNFYDDTTFTWDTNHINILKKLDKDEFKKEKFMVLLQKGDELLDYKDAIKKYKDAKVIVEDGGSHSFEGIENHFENIREFFAVGKQFKHTPRVKGTGLSNRVLAYKVGDLYYDDMAEFFKYLARKLSMDAFSDKAKGKVKLSNELFETSKAISEAKEHIQKAWEICAISTIRWMEKNGYNKTPTISCKKDIPKEITSRLTNFDFKDIRFLYDSTDILPLRLEYNYLLDKNDIFKGKNEEKFLKEYFEKLGFKIFENDIKPYFQPTSHPDEDRGYLRFYYLKRYIAVKGDIVFYYDIEGILDDEEHSFLVFHYDEDAKALIEGMFG